MEQRVDGGHMLPQYVESGGSKSTTAECESQEIVPILIVSLVRPVPAYRHGMLEDVV